MESPLPLSAFLAALFVVVLAARQMGDIFARFKLPLISGFLFVGVVVGPFVLDFVHEDDIARLLVLDELSLAFIAFAAGAELELQVIRGYFRSIISLIGGQVVAVMVIGVVAIVLLQDLVPFMSGLPQGDVLAIALLGATIFVARSPSSVLAIIKELRAHGPFTHKVLGATVLMDAVVIIIFAASVSVAAVLLEGAAFDGALLLFVLFEIVLDLGLGILVGLALRGAMKLPFNLLRGGVILLLGLGVFYLSTELHDFRLFSLPVGIFSEPLLICMAAGFYVSNYSSLATDFRHVLEEMAPAIFLLFFTLVGIELELDVIGRSWAIMLILFAVRAAGIFVGSFAGSLIAGDRNAHNALLGFGFLTQAGVSVGLAKEIGVEFGEWGPELATLSIGVIVLTQVVGPPLLKWAINRVGEAHRRAESGDFDGIHDAVIFGLTRQSVQLAHQLSAHGWQLRLVCVHPEALQEVDVSQVALQSIPEISPSQLGKLSLAQTDAIVSFLSDEESFQICELAYEKHGISRMVVLLNDRTNFERFHELGVKVVEPKTAVVSLLEHMVRSPTGASLLLGMDGRQDVVDIEVRNPDLQGVRLRDLHLPLEVLVLSVSRGDRTLISHGYTRLRLGDRVTIVGLQEKLADVVLRFEG
ncbi:MAG TPA: cation:proton antiporter [Candidatus Binatia bacterium]|nr:cation:proton antiporter [Candidatus Binatia bacterium]